MKCPECNGSKKICLDSEAEFLECPTCEGEGQIPDPMEFPNNCLACGEPILEDHDYCDFHETTVLLDGSHQNSSKEFYYE